MARRAGAPAYPDESDPHHLGRLRGVVRCVVAHHQRLCELPPRLVCCAKRLKPCLSDERTITTVRGRRLRPPTCRVTAFPPQTWPAPLRRLDHLLVNDSLTKSHVVLFETRRVTE